MKMQIREVIVVEGKADVSAVKAAVDAHLIAVGGFGVRRPAILAEIKAAHERCGVIVFTDPDRAGEEIRATITRAIPDVKHAYIRRDQGRRERDGKLGIEHASTTAIKGALLQARSTETTPSESFAPFVMADLVPHRLVADPEARARREWIGVALGIGYANAKQFVRKLNHFEISVSELHEMVERYETSKANPAA